MGDAAKKLLTTRAEFLAYLDSIEGKAEFLDGEIYDMAGGTAAHSLIATNITSELRGHLKGSGCRAYNSDLTYEIEADGAIVFPDASVICGDLQATQDRNDIFTNPTLIVEVLSASNWRYDRGGKLRKYMTIPSLKEYVIIEQLIPQVDVMTLTEDGGWRFATYQDMTDFVVLHSLGIQIPLTEIYLDVVFG
ncbi:MAG: Uma2 family endonuclease [Bacteroidetes bacterium]|nr:Uma2 family endonuclease [Bacteroidota bacterium]